MKIVEQSFANEKVATYPKFKAGDTITVTYRIKEGDKERLQNFRGVVIQERGATPTTRTFTQSPFIENIELNKVGKVRRARIFYLRNLSGKKARIKERKFSGKKAEADE